MTASTDTQTKPTPKRIAVRVICIAAASLLLLFLAVGGIILSCGLVPLTAEAGEDIPQAAGFVRFPMLPFSCQSDLTDSSFAQVGEHTVHFSLWGISMQTTLTVQDTMPPRFTVKHHGIRPGDPVAPEDFIAEVQDFSPYTAEMLLPENIDGAGEHSVQIRLTDAWGNYGEQSASLFVFSLPDVLLMEAGSDADARRDVLQNAVPGAVFAEEISVEKRGQKTVSIQIDGFTFPLLLDVCDTRPPMARVLSLTVPGGSEEIPEPADFLTNLSDASAVTVAYANTPDFTTPGKRGVTLILTDEAGNVTRLRATFTVTAPEEPALPPVEVKLPVIRGVKNLVMNVGTWISYQSGVSAADSEGNPLTVEVNSSAVKRNEPGVYTIFYTATDKNGNTAAAQATVTVCEITEEILRPYVNKVLNKILTENMTQLEKARAIYDWMKANVSYTAFAYMDHWMRAAYSGFLNGRGDCYVYYAMARSLLDAAGIENMEICRDITAKPHNWNLVNCGDGWYHFDTCPHYKQYPLESFMLTDAEVKAYSENCVKDYYSFDASLYPATP